MKSYFVILLFYSELNKSEMLSAITTSVKHLEVRTWLFLNVHS